MSHPPVNRAIVGSLVATVISAFAVVLIAHVTGANAIGHAFQDVDLPWLALVAVAELLTYPAYMVAYRSIACMHGHAAMSLPMVARIVVAGFGPFSLAGGFGIDKQALETIDSDERSARIRVIALGTLEWAVLAPVACGVSIYFLISGENVMPSLIWPWAVAVPIGLGLAFWASAHSERLARIGGKRKDWLAQTLEGVGVLHSLVHEPRKYAGAWVGTTLYWAADIFAFYGALRMFGLDPGAGKVIIAYGTGYAATRRSLPLGGAGVTEALMVFALYWLREPLAPSLAAVLVYRVFNFLLVAAPAIVAHRQLQPMLAAEGRRNRRRRKQRAVKS